MFKRLILSLAHAWRGLKAGWRREHNLQVFSVVAGLVVIGMLGFQTSFLENAVLTLTIVAMFSLELLNSQIERFLDIISPQKNQLVKEIKDLSAGAVLAAALGAVVIGFLIFLPHFLQLLKVN